MRELMSRKLKTGRLHIFIIKKDRIKEERFQMQDFTPRAPLLKIKTRSMS